MDPHAKAAITLTAAFIAVTLCYVLACWIWPFRACRRCHGLGKRRSPSGRTFRYCRRCKGSGARLRAGRWIYNHLSTIRKASR